MIASVCKLYALLRTFSCDVISFGKRVVLCFCF